MQVKIYFLKYLQVKWEYWNEDKKSFMPYPEKISYKIETAKKKGENSVKFKDRGTLCEINIPKGWR